MKGNAAKTADRVVALMMGGWVAMMGCAAAPAVPELEEDLRVATEEQREDVAAALRQELDRSMQRLSIDDHGPPYFLSYHLRDEESYNLSARYGALTGESHNRQRYAYVETRVGDYEFDNFANIEAFSYRMGDFFADRTAPVDSDIEALRGALWLLTDQTYKQALSDYQTKRGGAIYSNPEDLEIPSFSRAEPHSHRGEVRPLQLDVAAWRQMARQLTEQMRDHDFLMDAKMNVTARRTVRYLVNSEGTDIVEEFTIYSVHAQAFTRADDGMLLENSRRFYARDADQLPRRDVIEQSVAEMIDDLDRLRSAPVLDPYTGPAILDPEASGVLFHEAVGHRLEGERQRDDMEGRTFAGQVGNRIMPTFLSIYDDPGLTEYAGEQLNGHYRFDDEGVPAQRASLVENGVLVGFLMSRTPIEDFKSSTGHGRAQGVNVPQARMANLVVEADPEATVSKDELHQMLLDEVRRQDKPYGLIIRDITGGSTNTMGFGYQAFKGVPRMIYKVDADTGEQTLVRGVEMVGTPLSAINEIEAAGDETAVFNGFCGAESGFVPVSTVAPALLTAEVELQRSQQMRERRPVLPPPWADPSDAEEDMAEQHEESDDGPSEEDELDDYEQTSLQVGQ